MLIPVQNSNKINCKIQDYFTNRQIKEDVKCNMSKHKKNYLGPNLKFSIGTWDRVSNSVQTISTQNKVSISFSSLFIFIY
jgi:hypothetical protein